MTLRLTQPFHRMYRKLPRSIQRKVDRQLYALNTNLQHPGLKIRKMAGLNNIWEARIDIHHRMTFTIIGDLIILRKVGTHEIYRKP